MNKHILKRMSLYRDTNYYTLVRGLYWFLRAKIFKMPNLKYMDVSLDYLCNMACHHCFASSLRKKEAKNLTIDQYYKIASDARSIGCLHFNLQGGEPLIIGNLSEYIKAFKPHLCHVSITTNGFHFTEEVANNLKKSGVKQIIFSLDSSDPQQHDEFRSLKGAYSRVIEAIKLARIMEFGVSVNVTVSHDSLNDESQKKLFDWFHTEMIPYNPILACPVGEWDGRMELMVTGDDVDFINSMRQKHNLAQRDIHASWVKEGCAAVAEQLYLTPGGDVMPCPFIHISIGNVHEESIDSIWRRMMSKGIYGQYSKRCWVAEDEYFARDLGNLSSDSAQLPVSHKNPDGYNLLSRHWNKSRHDS